MCKSRHLTSSEFIMSGDLWLLIQAVKVVSKKSKKWDTCKYSFSGSYIPKYLYLNTEPFKRSSLVIFGPGCIYLMLCILMTGPINLCDWMTEAFMSTTGICAVMQELNMGRTFCAQRRFQDLAECMLFSTKQDGNFKGHFTKSEVVL